MIARDTVVAGRLAEDVRAAEQHAFVVAGEHEYGDQLDRQLDHVGLPRVERPEDADLVVLCGLAGRPEVARAAALGLPVIAFDGVQGGAPIPDCSVMLPFEPDEDPGGADADEARHRPGRHRLASTAPANRATLLSAIRTAGPFDEHGDPVDRRCGSTAPARTGACKPDRPL